MPDQRNDGEGRSGYRFQVTLLNLTAGGFVAIALIGALVLYVRSGVRSFSRTQEARQKANKDLDQFKPMPGSIFVRRATTASGEHGTVTDYYRSEDKREAIRSYYLQEFQQLGWRFQLESRIPLHGEDVGATELVFCKDNERAALFFVGAQQMSDNVTYTVGTSWGLGCAKQSLTMNLLTVSCLLRRILIRRGRYRDDEKHVAAPLHFDRDKGCGRHR